MNQSVVRPLAIPDEWIGASLGRVRKTSIQSKRHAIVRIAP